MTNGERCYNLAAKGLSWKEVAVRMYHDVHKSKNAQHLAKHFAEMRGMPWPLKRVYTSSSTPWDTYNKIGADAYELRTHSYLTWRGVAALLGTTTAMAIHLARKHARRKSLEWPIPRSPKGERAYSLRTRGWSWKEIETWLYGDDVSVHNKNSRYKGFHAALKYARRNALPWPLKENENVQQVARSQVSPLQS